MLCSFFEQVAVGSDASVVKPSDKNASRMDKKSDLRGSNHFKKGKSINPRTRKLIQEGQPLEQREQSIYMWYKLDINN